MIKCSSNAGTYWNIWDSARNTYNASYLRLYPNANSAEDTSVNFDALSNGFKFRNVNSDMNENGFTYVYAAFAENPFKYANAR
jgi:hypothetical protein